MDPLEHDDSMAKLTAEMAWMRRLARALLRDDAAADVAQDAWLAAAECRPADVQLRPWLSRVVANLVRMQLRSRRRREAREAAAPAPEATSGPEELVQRVELQQLVAREVLKLAEPYRSTVLLRYFEELSCAEIARRAELPEGTVRRRLKVALDDLRERIGANERRSGGLAVLAPLAGMSGSPPHAAPGALGVIAMKKLIVALVVLLVIILGAVVWKSRDRAHNDTAADERTASGFVAGAAGTTSADEPPLPAWLSQRGVAARRIAGRVTFRGAPIAGATVELASIASESGLVSTPRRTTNVAGEFDFGPRTAMEWSVRASAPGKSGAAIDIDLRNPRVRSDRLELELGACTAAMVGTIRDASGGPIAKARVVWLALRGARLSRQAVPGGPAAISDDKGAYELCLETRWPGWVAVQVSADGYGAITYQTVVPGRITVDFALLPEAVIVGRVIRDDTGAAVPRAFVFVPAARFGVEGRPQRAAFTDDNGRFRIDRLAPGHHQVFARADGMAETPRGTPVTVGVGQTSMEIEIRLAAGSTIRGRVVDGDTPIAGARVAAVDAVRGGASAISQDDGSFVLEGVPRGRVRFAAPPYDVKSPTTFEVTQPVHDGVTIEVESRGAIIGRVVRNNQPVAGANIDIHGPNDGELEEVRADATGHFEVRGLQPGPWTLFASDDRNGAFGRAPQTVNLARGQTSEVTIDLAFSASISGRVVDQNGNPVAGVTVVFRNTRSDDSGVTATSSDGTFRAAEMTGGAPYRPVVSRNMYSPGQFAPASGSEFPLIDVPDATSEITGVTLAVQLDRLSIAGRVVDSDGAPVADARVVAELAQGDEPPRFASGLQNPAATSDVDGRFSIDELSSGTYALRARSPAGVEAMLVGVRAGRSDVAVVLPTPGAIEATAVGFKAAPSVSAQRTDGGASAPSFATAEGNVYALHNLSPGTYTVSARNTSEAATTVVQVVAGRTARTTLASDGSGVVAGRVREFRTGKPIEGITCHALPRVGSDLALSGMGDGVRTDPQGAFVLDPAPAGQLAVWCGGVWRNYSTGMRLVALAASQRIDIDVPVVAKSEEPGITLGGLGADIADDGALAPRLVRVQPGGPAAVAGFQAGDVIVMVDGASVTELSPNGVWLLIINRAPGTKVKIGVSRAGKPVNGEVTLGAAPS